jgi:SAM-dependent methyltransferase
VSATPRVAGKPGRPVRDRTTDVARSRFHGLTGSGLLAADAVHPVMRTRPPPIPVGHPTRANAPISFDRVADVYDASRSLPDELQGEVLAHLATHLRGGRTLDLGAGTGRFSAPLQREMGLEIVAADVSPRMLAAGRSRGLGDIVLADARRLPFRDKSFDRTTTTHLLHLIADWRLALREIVRVTRSEYLSVIDHTTEDPDLGEEYDALAKKAGIDTAPPGLPERRLVRHWPPERTEPIGGYRITRPATDVIDELRDRIFRNQWNVPSAVHRQIIRALRRHHPHGEVEVSLTIGLAIWPIDRLSVAAAGTMTPG